jgi:hypothetical protein
MKKLGILLLGVLAMSCQNATTNNSSVINGTWILTSVDGNVLPYSTMVSYIVVVTGEVTWSYSSTYNNGQAAGSGTGVVVKKSSSVFSLSGTDFTVSGDGKTGSWTASGKLWSFTKS